MITIIIGFLIFCFIVMFPIALIKVAKSKSFKCPSCDREVKLITTTAKCPFCKTKLFKHSNGEYQIRQ